MGPAAILNVLVRAQGATATITQLKGVDSAGRTAARGTDSLAASQKKGRAAMDQVGRKAGLVAVGVGAIGGAAVNAAAKYEQSMNTLQAVSGQSAGEMRKVSKLAIKLGADVRLPGTSAQDAAEAMTEMIKSGVSLRDTMEGVRSTLVLSAAAGVSNKEAAEIASNALNTFKLRGKDVAFVTDQLANTANASSVEIRDVADSFKMAGAVFNGLQSPVLGAKGAMTELNTAIGILGNAGIKGSDAGTSLKQMLLQLTGPSDRAKGAMEALYIAAKGNTVSEDALGTAIRGTAKERGAAIATLQKANPELKKQGDIAYDAQGKMRSLKDIIALVSAGTKDMTQEQKNAYITQIFGADATRSVLTLMNAGPAAFDKMTGAVTKQGSAQALADAKMKGFKGSLEAAKSALETMAINIGTKLLPAFTDIVKKLTSVVGALSPTAWLVLIGTIGTLAAAVWGINAAVKVYKATQTAITAATWLWNAAQKALNFTLKLNPIGLVVTALALLAAGLVIAYKKSETFRAIVDAVVRTLRNGFLGAISAVLGGLSSFLGAIAKAARAVGADGLANKAQAGANAIDRLRTSLENAKDKSTPATRALDEFKRSIDSLPNRKTVEIVAGVTVKESNKNKAANFDQMPGGDGPGRAVRSAISGGTQRVADDAVKAGRVGGVVGLIPGLGRAVGSLLGANSSLQPFAAIGARYGLHVSSGKRSGSGGSYHNTGRAVDLANGAGPDAAKLATFRALKSRYGSQLAELIYTPGGVGIKDGRPFRYTGDIAADHFDHVHVAFAGGAMANISGTNAMRGDGHGRFMGDGLGSNAKRIWQFLRSKGLSPAQAAGVMGNIQHESGYDPSAVEGGGRGEGHGIAQWSFDRRKALMAFAAKRGKPWNNLDVQLEFLGREMSGSHAAATRALRGTHDVASAANVWERKFEAPKVIEDRSGAARAAFNAFKNVGAGGGGGGSGNTSATRAQIERNKDRIDALRQQARHLPGGKKGRAQRIQIQDKIAALLGRNRDLNTKLRGAPTTAERVNPLDQKLASADLAIQQAKRGPITVGAGVGKRKVSSELQQVVASLAKRKLIGKRIQSIRRALKKHQSPAKRLALTNELTQRLSEHAQLGTDIQALRNPAVDAAAAGDLGGGGDIGGGGGDGGDPNQALIDSNAALAERIAESVEAERQHTEALAAVRNELKRQSDIASAIQNTSSSQTLRYLTDLISGQIVGRGVVGRSFTPGTGVEASY